ncbi:MAG: DNA polymerase III subunit alpha [Candidatus Entotheonella gemina]|uniref:DNA polymerase III subunit alpha n=1 Tax=Candidatus Entotheonella gemina TaxID=1429439 RepID=W4LLZ0_9BACT|nr:MAG: DNA polymerase III subunit alpha [Candidatus Entotheonella gemina]
MSNPQLRYFEQGDVLHLMIAEGKEIQSVEINPHVTLELNEGGDVIGIEILDATRFIRDFVLESAQAKMLNLDGRIPHEAS